MMGAGKASEINIHTFTENINPVINRHKELNDQLRQYYARVMDYDRNKL